MPFHAQKSRGKMMDAASLSYRTCSTCLDGRILGGDVISKLHLRVDTKIDEKRENKTGFSKLTPMRLPWATSLKRRDGRSRTIEPRRNGVRNYGRTNPLMEMRRRIWKRTKFGKNCHDFFSFPAPLISIIWMCPSLFFFFPGYASGFPQIPGQLTF